MYNLKYQSQNAKRTDQFSYFRNWYDVGLKFLGPCFISLRPKDWKEKLESTIINYVGGIRIRGFKAPTTEVPLNAVNTILERINKCSDLNFTSLDVGVQWEVSMKSVMLHLGRLTDLYLSWKNDHESQNWTEFFSEILNNENVQLKSLTLFDDKGCGRPNPIEDQLCVNALISIEEVNIQYHGNMMPMLIETIASTSKETLKIKRLSTCWYTGKYFYRICLKVGESMYKFF